MASVQEDNGSDSYTVSYTYSVDGDRAMSEYNTPQGDTKWGYSDYFPVGSGNRVFRTMSLLDANGAPTSEQFFYAYDLQGRLVAATFAMSPQSGQTGYSTAYPPQTRARAFYDYDPGGRLLSIEHYWDTWNPPVDSTPGYYRSSAILKNSCVYDSYKGLKTASSFSSADPATGQWKATPDRTETYGYDPSRDYLTSVDYGDGLPNAQQSWTYDAAGNRATDSVQGNGWAYDNLNRITASPGFTYDHDLAGNRLHRYVAGSQAAETTYGWDDNNRLDSLANSSATWAYASRADGMRISASTGGDSTLFRYDGQMGVQEEETLDGATTITRYALGTRGVDRLAVNSSVSYPLYDAHGNMVATLAVSNGQFSLGNQRSYTAWGEVRSGGLTGRGYRYNAKLCHVTDGQTGLIYMRARYLESSTGRFLNADPDKTEVNDFMYCANDPVNRVDASGKSWEDLVAFGLGLWMVFMGICLAFGTSIDVKGIANNALWQLTKYKNADQISGKIFDNLKKGFEEKEAELAQRASNAARFSAITKLMGYMMIIEGAVIDTSIATSHFDVWDTLFGDHQ